MYPAETIYLACAYVATVAAITFYFVGYFAGRAKLPRRRLDTSRANKPISYPLE